MAKKLNKNFEQNEQPKKKVKKVGRPKKRGRKKEKYSFRGKRESIEVRYQACTCTVKSVLPFHS